MTREDINQRFLELAPEVALVAMRQFRLSYDEVVDAMQHAYIRLRRRLEGTNEPPLDTRFALRSYMIGAVRSHVSHERERSRVRQRNETLLWHALVSKPPTDPESELITREESARLWTAIRSLDEPYRSIFNLLVGKEMALIDIARQLGVSRKGIYSQYARGMRHLRKILADASGNATPGGNTG